MKSLIIGLALFAVAPAFAKSHKAPKDCTPYIVTVGEAAGEYIMPCGPGAVIPHRACNEGEYAYGTEMGPSGEYVQTTLVCKNGRFATVAPVAHRTCNEGEVAYSNEYGASGELVEVVVVCKNGRFVRR